MNLWKTFNTEFFGVDGKRLDSTRLLTLRTMLEEIGYPFEKTRVYRLESKKNIVLHIVVNGETEHVSQSIIAKLFVTEGFEREMALLRLCNEKGFAVPQLLRSEDGVILMQYIPGETLVETVNRTFDPQIAELLADWYFRFHSITNVLKGDPRLRNFIATSEGIIGLDFEEAHPGHWIVDIGGICASILDTTPVFDVRKRRLVWVLLDRYLRCMGEKRTSAIEGSFLNSVADALAETAHWRQDTRLLELAHSVRTKGIHYD